MKISSRSLARCLLALVCTLGISAADPVKKPDSAEKLPPAEEIIERFVKELGGKPAFDKIRSQEMKGSYELPAQGIKGTLEVLSARPNKLVVKIDLAGAGKITTGYDGQVAWLMTSATGPMLLQGKQKEQIAEQADFDSVLHDKKDFKSMKTVGKKEFEGKSCYEIRLVRNNGAEQTEFYGVDSGLMEGFIRTQESELGTITVTNVVNEYKKFEDVKLPVKVTQKMGPIDQVMNVTSVEFNKAPESAFELPAEVKALVTK